MLAGETDQEVILQECCKSMIGSENCSDKAYGNMNNEHSFLYDRKQVISICYNGQLMLLMLIEMLTEIGCDIISANTDGITAIVPKHLESQYYNVCKNWEILTKMELEYAFYDKLIRYAVNDYLAVKTGYETANSIEKKKFLKEKGLFITESRIGKGLSPLIIPKALQEYFLNKIPISETINNCKDITQFLMSEKTGKQWTVIYNNVQQQHTNRFYASMNGHYLIKWKPEDLTDNTESLNKQTLFANNETNESKKLYQNMLKDSGVTLFNKFQQLEDYKINYNYYIKECNKLIEEIEPKQLTLF